MKPLQAAIHWVADFAIDDGVPIVMTAKTCQCGARVSICYDHGLQRHYQFDPDGTVRQEFTDGRAVTVGMANNDAKN